jgi:hypothetical protein
MNVASLELCEELSELSDWRESKSLAAKVWCRNGIGEWMVETAYHGVHPGQIQAYDLGYLIRRLPDDDYEFIHDSDGWYFRGVSPYADSGGSYDAPEDAVAKVAIELFKRGVLTK